MAIQKSESVQLNTTSALKNNITEHYRDNQSDFFPKMENKHGPESAQSSQIISIDTQADIRVRTSTANSDQKHLKTENTIKVQNQN